MGSAPGWSATSAMIPSGRPSAKRTPARCAGTADGLGQLLRGQRQNDLGLLPQQLAQRRVLQRAVVEVGAQGDQQPQLAAGIVRAPSAVDRQMRGAISSLFDQRVELFELVDDQQQLRALFVVTGR